MRKKLVFITLAVLVAVILSGCTGGAVRGTTWAGLTASGETAYLADGAFVYAVNLKDGRELWHYPAKANSKQLFYAAPVITSDGLVIVGSAGNDHILVAINPADIDPETKSPVEAWTFTAARDHWVASPLIIGDKLFAPNGDGNLYILDLSDKRSTKEAVKVIELGGRLWAQPVTDGQHIFITSLDHSVIAVDVETYEVLWHEDVDGAIPGSAVIGADGMLYVGSLASQLEKFDPATGKHQPVFNAKTWLWGTPVSEGDSLYFGDLEGNFYSFNTSSGELNWAPVKPDGSITGSPLLLQDYILIATETGVTSDSAGTVFALDRGGKILWSEEVGGKLYTSPVAAGDLILVAPLGADFYLAALDPNGRQVWAFTPEN